MKENQKPQKNGSIPETPDDSNPFAGLLGKFPVTSSPPEKALPAKPTQPFRIAKTKKGGYPIFREKRAAGKTVTIVRNLSGDTDALLTLLKRRCAAGGKAFEDSVEIQGDHCEKLEILFKELGL